MEGYLYPVTSNSQWESEEWNIESKGHKTEYLYDTHSVYYPHLPVFNNLFFTFLNDSIDTWP